MISLQDFGYEYLGNGQWKIFGRCERMNESSGIWETVADFTGNNALLFPDGWSSLSESLQESFISQFAPHALAKLATGE